MIPTLIMSLTSFLPSEGISFRETSELQPMADATVMAVVRYQGYQDSYDSEYVNRPRGTDDPTPLAVKVYKHTLTVVTPVHGLPLPSQFIYADDTNSPMNSPGQRFVANQRYLFFGYKPDSQLTALSDEDSEGPRFRVQAADHYSARHSHDFNFVELPSGQYHSEGATQVEKYVSILSQAYVMEQDKKYLDLMSQVAPYWSVEDGQRRVWPGYQGPTFFDFFVTNVEPRLFLTAGADQLKRAKMLALFARMGDLPKKDLYLALVHQLDTTLDPVNESYSFGIGYVMRTYREINREFLSARLPALRAEAIASFLPASGVRSVVIGALSDNSPFVRYRAIVWLDAHGERRDAPRPDYDRVARRVRNEQDVIHFWQHLPE